MNAALRLLIASLVVLFAPLAYAEQGDIEDSVGTLITTTVANAVATSTAGASQVAKTLQTGLASYYARGFEARRTASGEIFRHAANIAAHPTWPLGTIARVTNLATGRSAEVRIMDRGPFGASRARGVIIDLSQSTASELDMIRAGIAKVKVEVLEWGKTR